MLNLDTLKAQKTVILQRLSDAVKANDPEAFAQAFNDLAENLQQAVMAEAQGMIASADNTILAGRGVRQLTSEENKFYQKLTDALRSSNPKQALTSASMTTERLTTSWLKWIRSRNMAKKTQYSKKLVTGISIVLVLFIIAVLAIYWYTGSEPSVLIGAVFAAALGEYWQLAGIKKAEIKKGDQSNEPDRLENEIDK